MINKLQKHHILLLLSIIFIYGCSDKNKNEVIEKNSPQVVTYDTSRSMVTNTLADSLFRKGVAYLKMDSDKIGLDICKQAASLALEMPPIDTAILLKCYSKISISYYNKQMYDSAWVYLNKTENYFNDPEKLSRQDRQFVYRNLASVYTYFNKLDKAQAYLNSAAKLISPNDSASIIANLKSLADSKYNTANYNDAIGLNYFLIDYNLNQLNKHTEIEKKQIYSELVVDYNSLALCYVKLGNLNKYNINAIDSSFYSFHNALHNSLMANDEKSRDVCMVYLDLAVDHTSFYQNWDSVMYYLKKFNSSFPKNDPAYNFFYNVYYNYQSLVLAYLGKVDEARKRAIQNLAHINITEATIKDYNFNKTNDIYSILGTLDITSCVYQTLFTNTHIEDYGRIANELNEKIHSGQRLLLNEIDPANLIQGIDTKLSFNGRETDLKYELSKYSNLELSGLYDVFEERKSLLLKQNYDLQSKSGFAKNNNYEIFSKLLEKRAALADQVSLIVSNKNEYMKINEAIDSLITNIGLPSSSNAPVDNNNLPDIQKYLKQTNTAVLNFSKTDDSYFSLYISDNDFLFNKISTDSILINKLNNYYLSLKENQIKDLNPLSNDLYKILVENNIPKNISQKNLIIIPDGELGNIPFESLISFVSEDSIKNLADDYNIRYEYSMSFLLNKKKDEKQNDGILAFAPTYEKINNDQNKNLQAGVSKNIFVEQPNLRAGIGPLRFNVEEVNNICSHFKGTEFTGNDATEQSFRKNAEKYNILHFATHAFSNAENPNLSGIVLKVNNSDSISGLNTSLTYSDSLLERDNILHAYEIQNMNLGAELVVLSACETNVGKYRAGEGAMSLARAFKYANCPNIVSSLWKVDDASTKEIMGEFYDNLGNKMGKADALAEAKKTFRKKHPNASPFYWASFVLVGDNEPVLLSKKSNFVFWMVASTIILIVAVATRKRKRKIAA